MKSSMPFRNKPVYYNIFNIYHNIKTKTGKFLFTCRFFAKRRKVLYKKRSLRPEENWKSNLTMAVAFEGDYDLEKAKESAARERAEEEKRKMHATAASAHF